MKKEVYFDILERPGARQNSNLQEVRNLAQKVLAALERHDIQLAISEAHVLHASSHTIQNIILSEIQSLGFSSEKKGLFAEYSVPGLRPDYFCPLDGGGVLFEVERGKTIANNMDLLDIWKAHLCKDAKHLFLMIPKNREQTSGKMQNIYKPVLNRMGSFFNESAKEIDVDSVTLFGY